ncbi:GNAT family N-acetyltransferase [Streptomyces sp. NPDC005876]|uniref:GNAT family N-acetyltransferase n=1 Tax=Streptomyces sp. NPDC005876 TaxID=3157076 RepID=UPI0033CECE5A
MSPDDWYLTEDVDEFLARAGDFLHARPAPHTVALTVTEALRSRGPDAFGAEAPVFGLLEEEGEVRAAFFRTPPAGLNLTSVTGAQADLLAARLAGAGHVLPGVRSEEAAAAVFARAWRRHAGATPVLRERQRLYRLGTLTPPEPFPEGRARWAGERDVGQVVRWNREFMAAVGEDPRSVDERRVGHRRYVFWETPDGTPVSMAGVNPPVAGQVRVGPVYTPAHSRGRGYAGAVTAEATRDALAEGAKEVVLFADLANPTSNALYRRLGYVPVADFALYDFT